MTFLLALQNAAAVGPSYTAAEVLTFFVAAGTLLGGLLSGIAGIIVAWRAGSKIEAAAKKTETLVTAVQEVHAVTNSNLSAVKAELTTSNALNASLRDIISDLKAEREKAAIAVALATPVAERSHDTRAGDATATDQLTQIADNTKATVEVLKDQATKGDPP